MSFKQRLRLEPGLRITLSTLSGVLVGLAFVAALWKGSEFAVVHMQRVNGALQRDEFVSFLKADSTRRAATDKALLDNQRDIRSLLCYVAKNPTAMVVSGVCPNPTQPRGMQ